MLHDIFRRKHLAAALGAAAAMALAAAPVYAQTAGSSQDTGSASASTNSSGASQNQADSHSDWKADQSSADKNDKNSSGSSGASGMTGSSASGNNATSSGSDTAAAGQSAAGSESSSDKKLMRELAYTNLDEIATGKLALQKSNDAQVKQFAQKMVDDHTQALDKLQQLAQQKGVQLPTQPDEKHQAIAKRLESLSGDKFDREYMKMAGLRDHKHANKLASHAESKAKDPQLKQLAQQMDTVIEQHLQLAKNMNSTDAATQSTGSSGSTAGSSKSSKDMSSGSSGASSSDSGSGMSSGTSGSSQGSTGTADQGSSSSSSTNDMHQQSGTSGSTSK